MTVRIDNDAYLKAAVIAGNSAAMDRAADTLLRNIKAEAAKHNLTTAFMRSWSVRTAPGESGNGRQVNDRVVVTDDPGALAINYGHFNRQAKGSNKIPDFVPGKHIVEKAIGRTA